MDATVSGSMGPRVMRTAASLCLAAFLSACGSDRDTSSGSGAQAPDSPVQDSAFAGTYRGTVNINLSALGQTIQESGRGSLVVNKNGQIAGRIFGRATDLPCDTTVSARNVNAGGGFSFIESGSCDASSEGLGVCSIRVEISGTITGNALRGSGPIVLDCRLANAKGSASINATKG